MIRYSMENEGGVLLDTLSAVAQRSMLDVLTVVAETAKRTGIVQYAVLVPQEIRWLRYVLRPFLGIYGINQLYLTHFLQAAANCVFVSGVTTNAVHVYIKDDKLMEVPKPEFEHLAVEFTPSSLRR